MQQVTSIYNHANDLEMLHCNERCLKYVLNGIMNSFLHRGQLIEQGEIGWHIGQF